VSVALLCLPRFRLWHRLEYPKIYFTYAVCWQRYIFPSVLTYLLIRYLSEYKWPVRACSASLWAEILIHKIFYVLFHFHLPKKAFDLSLNCISRVSVAVNNNYDTRSPVSLSFSASSTTLKLHSSIHTRRRPVAESHSAVCNTFCKTRW